MPENIFFYLVFMGQIFLISFYYPQKIMKRFAYILKTYPVEEYPKLYPRHPDYYLAGQTLYRIGNYLILGLGVVILGLVAYWDIRSSGKVSEMVPVAYFFVQVLPLLLMEISGFAYFKLMRKGDVRTIRKAHLQRRRLLDYVSPYSLGAALFMLLACIVFFYSLHQIAWSFENETFIIAGTLVLSNCIFAGIIYWNLYGAKRDPYQAQKDYTTQVEVTIRSLVYMSIAASTFLIVIEAVDAFHWDFLEPVLMSLYFQFILFLGLGSLLRTRVEDVNFDVYKNDALGNN